MSVRYTSYLPTVLGKINLNSLLLPQRAGAVRGLSAEGLGVDTEIGDPEGRRRGGGHAEEGGRITGRAQR